ncbi:TIM-barrel domain-containing protein [Aquimarina sp. 2201CG5-10]|uniref:glycoside hydrolase family 31 protein n=1 Tax=Aquimarina callyspongiae TaxID=3098150 RepID=UPI002AB4A4FC|nr:TIM-barrel domain-containing protein [Aquimarina sp. 2201CG5-10]MDY8135563.1 glycoside hydrolase family 31 protein [Aquimarina sp. 2201CG5-10]
MRLLSVLLFASLLVVNISCKKKYEGPYQGFKDKGTHIEVYKDNGKYIITPFSDKIIETSFIPEGEVLKSESHAVVLTPNVKASIKEDKETLIYTTSGIAVHITKKPFAISYSYKGKELISEQKGYVKTDSTEILNFNLDTKEVIYGAGARVVGMNRRGKRLELYNKAHYGYGNHSELMNYTMPLVLSSKIYAVHFDNPSIGFLDIDSKKDNTLSFETIGGRKTYQVVAGDDWKDLIDQYTDLTGKQPIPPRWVFGNFASRFGYHSQKEVEETIAKFKKDSIPLDAVILDIYWFGKDIKGHMGNLEFLKDSFPEPKQMINDLKNQGIKTILITEPFILSTSKKWDEAVEKKILGKDSLGNPYKFDFYFGNTGIVDIYDPKGKDWFWNIYKQYTQEYGVAGWWGDLGEPEVHPSDLQHAAGSADQVHNIYGHDWARLVQEGFQKDFPNQRPFILMRAGYSGSQRFGMIPWSGDVSRSWEGLQSQAEIALSMGMQGLGYMHSDLGGFAGGEVFNPELYTRWLQYGVFQPIFRPHAQEHIAPEPVFHDKKTKALAKKSIELRYSLIPYNYTLAFDNYQTGIPLMRPLFFGNSEEEELQDVSFTYLWGDNFLVSPVVKPDVASMDVLFPKGNIWYDFFTGQKYEGGAYRQVQVVEEHIPVFVKAGAFIPMVKPVQTTDLYSTKEIILHYYHDTSVKNSSGKMYNDDGKTLAAYEKEQYEILKFGSVYSKNKLSIHLDVEKGSDYSFQSRKMILIIHNIEKAPQSIVLDEITPSYKWNPEDKTVSISLDWDTKMSKIVNLQLL